MPSNKFDFTHIIPGHGDVVTKDGCRSCGRISRISLPQCNRPPPAGAGLEEMKQVVADQLAPKYEQGMTKYPLGQYRDRIGTNIEAVYRKVVHKG